MGWDLALDTLGWQGTRDGLAHLVDLVSIIRTERQRETNG
jgi:hypothetical protein